MASPHEDPFKDPADGDEEPEDQETSEAAMQEMMGFSNFTGTKRSTSSIQKRGADQISTDKVVRTTGANSQRVIPRDTNRSVRQSQPSTSTSAAVSMRGADFLPASLPPKPAAAFSTAIVSEAVPSVPSAEPGPILGSTSRPTQSRGERSYTNPVTGITLSAEELREYAGGRRVAVDRVSEEHGSSQDHVTVYFQPSFIEDDPWKGLA